MVVTATQTAAIKEVVQAILSQTARGKRPLAAMFMELVDRQEWPHYFEVIPEPRCLKNIQIGLEKSRYKDALDVYTDLSLVFWNALFYNEPKSQIAADAASLKSILETEWKKRTSLPAPRSSPPPSSAQKVHGVVDNEPSAREAKPPKETKNERGGTPLPPSKVVNEPLPAGSGPSRPVALSQRATAATGKSVQTPSKSVQGSTRDMEVDVVAEDDGQEEEGQRNRPERDPLSEEIVKQLEKGLPRWSGFGEEGWMEDVSTERIIDIVSAIKSYKDVIGNRLASCLEVLPEESSSALHLASTEPISLKQIESRARHKLYKQAKDFDMDMVRLFEKARRLHDPGSESYGKALLLQRIYQTITGYNPPIPPYVSSTNFAALRAGPGNVKPLHSPDGEGVPNVTTHRVLTKDRTFVEEVHYKGWKLRIADWVHLANPDDPSRPVIGQVFRCWLSDEMKGRPHITVSWYYRPEQTFHTSSRVFWQNEVFKTSHFADHPVEDIIEKIACQFTARHIRGRPRPPYWYLGFPLYVCDSRYNDRERMFVRIKNWNSCVPEEVRQNTEFMPIYPFERIVYPVRIPSPFHAKSKGGIKWPGGIVGHSDVPEGPFESDLRKRAAMNASTAALTPRVAAPSIPVHPTPNPPLNQLQLAPRRTPGPDKSIISAAGAPSSAHVEKISPETAKLFDRDPITNEVLWFAAPPLNQPRKRELRHSLTYLKFITAKRKKESSGSDVAMDIDDDPVNASKRARTTVLPSVTETMDQVVRLIQADS